MGSRTETVTMVLDRNYTLRSTLGHILSFKKDEPMAVPGLMVHACAEIGAKRVDGEPVFKAEPETKSRQPVDPGQRLLEVRAAIDKIIDMNERDDFTAGGKPTVTAVSREAGYKIDRNEIQIAWQQRNEDLANDAG